jgi:adenylate cyclase
LIERLKSLGVRRIVFDVLFLGQGLDSSADASLARNLGSTDTVLGIDFGSREFQGYQVRDLLLPHLPFRTPSTKLGLVALPEQDGTVRQFRAAGELGATDPYPTLAQAGAGSDAPEPGPNDLINHYGPAGTIRSFSYAQLLDPNYPPAPHHFRGKVAFVGLQLRSEFGPAQKDSFLTPFRERGRVFGVEIHATATANLLGKDWIRRPSPEFEARSLGVLCFILSLAILATRPFVGALLTISAAIGWSAVSYRAFLNGHYVAGATLFWVLLPLALFASTVFYYVVVLRQQRQTQRAFEHYLSPAMAKRVAQNPAALARGGKEVVCTALFSDIAGFTSISETMKPEAVASMLNEYFTEVVDVILDRDGTLIKYIGDAAFALWGAPVPVPNHGQRALETALEMRERISEFNRLQRYPFLKTRVGLHTGPMVVGNLGSARRFDYTAIGDSVNLAARLEGLNKSLGTSLLLSKEVLDAGAEHPDLLPLGKVQVAGKGGEVEIFTVLERPLASSEREQWLQALTVLRSAETDQTLRSDEFLEELAERFQKLQAIPPLCLVARLYEKEIREHLKQKEGTVPWDGTLRFYEK